MMNQTAPQPAVTFTLNGETRTFATRPDEKLLDLLRRNGYRGTKFGCGQGTCGACTVIMDGRAIYACLLYSMQAEGRDIRNPNPPKEWNMDRRTQQQTEMLQSVPANLNYYYKEKVNQYFYNYLPYLFRG